MPTASPEPAPPLPRRRLDLTQLRWILVSGKGGVGKTTLTAALGLAAVRKGKRVLLVESGPTAQIPALLGLSPPASPLSTTDPHPLLEGMDGFLLDPLAALDEYIQLRIRITPLVRRFTHWSVYRYFTRAAPGLKELMTIGKIWDLHRKRNGRRPHWDLIVLDGPPTGHVVSFLEVPRLILASVRSGPLHYEANRLEQLLDDARTALLFVTTPEEMPVNETLEALSAARRSLRVGLGPIVVNRLLPASYGRGDLPYLEALAKRPGEPGLLARAALFEAARARIQRWHLARLTEGGEGLPVLPLEQAGSGTMDRPALENLARQILEQAGGGGA